MSRKPLRTEKLPRSSSQEEWEQFLKNLDIVFCEASGCVQTFGLEPVNFLLEKHGLELVIMDNGSSDIPIRLARMEVQAPPPREITGLIGQKILTLIHKAKNVGEVTWATTWAELGFDSLDFTEFLMEVEDEMGITIPDEDANQFVTVGAVIAYVESLTPGSMSHGDASDP